MDGKMHLLAGGLTGFAVAHYTGADFAESLAFTLLGGFSGLVPDLDVGGKLTNTLSFRKKWLTLLLGLFGILLIIYSLTSAGTVQARWIGIGIGACLIAIPSLLVKQKTMLLLSGLAILVAGLYLQILWLLLFGVYTAAASRLSHRSLTHSLIGLAFFSLIARYLENDLQMGGIMLTCTLAYISHLILDMKWLPGNRRGVRLFQPFSKLEI